MAPTDLACMTSSQLKSFLDSFDDVLCDCDGVLWTQLTNLPGVKETVTKLRQCGKKVRFVSNNGTAGIAIYKKKFRELELDVDVNDVVYPTLPIIAHLKKINFDKEVFVISTSYMKEEFKKAGLVVAKDTPAKIEEKAAELLENVQPDESVGAVVIDLDINLNYVRLMKALNLLKRPDVLFLVGATDDLTPISPECFLLGPGVFQEILEKFSSRDPLRFGKPSEELKAYITEKFGIKNPSRTLFVGDSLEQDMEFATMCGYQKLLVLTGGTTSLDQVQGETQTPNFYISSFGKLHEVINRRLNI